MEKISTASSDDMKRKFRIVIWAPVFIYLLERYWRDHDHFEKGSHLLAEPKAYDAQIVSEEGHWTDFDVENFGKVETMPDSLENGQANLKPHLEAWTTQEASATNRSKGSHILFFNKNRKVASFTLAKLSRLIADRNNFEFHRYPKHHPYFPSSLSCMEEKTIVEEFQGLDPNKFHLVQFHTFYIDVAKYGLTPGVNYINMVRNPIDRLVSLFYFLRGNSRWGPTNRPPQTWFSKDFETCYHDKDPECQFTTDQWREQQLSFFCGNALECRQIGHWGAFQQAKGNLEIVYSVVGLKDYLEETLSVFEAYLPRFYRGALDYYRELGMSQPATEDTQADTQSNGTWRVNQQQDYPSISNETRRKMEIDLQLEMDFYHFARRRFIMQYEHTVGDWPHK